uniref:Uncharacterized protein n=1 Tax=Romanomermis culicivorax TaxID=13658 RepID=A0A915L5R5_ROMCU
MTITSANATAFNVSKEELCLEVKRMKGPN